jgi:hypothetical protein
MSSRRRMSSAVTFSECMPRKWLDTGVHSEVGCASSRVSHSLTQWQAVRHLVSEPLRMFKVISTSTTPSHGRWISSIRHHIRCDLSRRRRRLHCLASCRPTSFLPEASIAPNCACPIWKNRSFRTVQTTSLSGRCKGMRPSATSPDRAVFTLILVPDMCPTERGSCAESSSRPGVSPK